MLNARALGDMSGTAIGHTQRPPPPPCPLTAATDAVAAAFYTADNQALQQWFNVVDSDRSGQVNAAELQKALAQGGLNFSMKLVSSLIRMYDADRTAQLSFPQFCEVHKFLVRVQGGATAAAARTAPPAAAPPAGRSAAAAPRRAQSSRSTTSTATRSST